MEDVQVGIIEVGVVDAPIVRNLEVTDDGLKEYVQEAFLNVQRLLHLHGLHGMASG